LDAFNCYLYAQNRFYREWPSGEAVIKEDPKAAVYYAINVLDGPWPDDENGRYAENKISTDPSLALYYAKMVKGRWEKIEPSMATKPEWAYEYAKTVLGHQWDGPYAEDAEAIISNDPYTATLYCMDLKKPKRYDNPQTERRILDSIYGSLYAHTVAPDLTIQDLNDEVNYRLEVLHTGQDIDFTNVVEESKWDPDFKHPKPDVKTSSARVLVHYAIDHLKRRWPEAEPYILKNIGIEHNDRDYLYYYALLVIRPYDKENPDYDRGRWLEAEPFIVVDPHLAYGYARDILMERWKSPEVELGIINSGSAKYYAEYVAETSEDELREDIENKLNDLHYHDSIDLKDTIEEAIDNLLPLIVEAVVERDYSTMTPTTVYTYAITDYKTKQLHGEDYEPDPKAEAVMMRDPGAAYYYARDVINDGKCLGKRWEEAEPTIMSEPYWAYAYAKDVLGRRWKTAENVIKNNTYIAYLYARYIIKPSNPADYDHENGRWDLETESRILEDHDPVIPENDSEKESEICELYANNVAEMSIDALKSDIERKLNGLNSADDLDLSKTTEEGLKSTTQIIVESSEDNRRAMALFHIALDKKNAKEEGLTPKQESEILKSPEYAYKYAQYIIEGEWVEAEPIILTDQYWAFNYAKNVIKGTWKAAEPLILGGKDLRFALSYATDISKIRLAPMVELRIIEHFEDDDVDDYGYYLYAYCAEVAKMSVEDLKADAEMKISELTSGDNINLSGTIDESIDRLMPLIIEGLLPDPKKLTPQECYNYAYNFILKMDQDGKCEQWLSDAEEIIKHDPEYASAYAKNVLNHEPIRKADRKKRFISAEEYIMKSPKWAYIYARDIYSKSGQRDKLRWEDAEPFILQDPKYAYFYAQYVAHMPLEVIQADVDIRMGQMFPDENRNLTDTTEEAIDRLMPLIMENAEELPDFERMSPINAFNYVYFRSLDKDNVNKMRCPEAERTIIKDPHVASLYAQFVLGERWYIAEPIIIKDLGRAKVYADRLVKIPFKDFLDEVKSTSQFFIKNDETDLSGTAEEAIDRLMPLIAENKVDPEDYDINRRDALECYTTARFVIKKRWPKAEPKILTHPYASYLYANYVLDRPWRQAEPIISTDAKSSLYYALYVLKRRWPEGEMAIKQDPECAYYYAEDVIKPFDKDNPRYDNGRWEDPKTELLILNAPWEMPYAENVAVMTREDLLAEIELKIKDIVPHDDINLTDTTDEAIDRLIPLINETSRKDYWGRRKEFKEYYPISNWLDKAINKIRARFFGSYSTKFQQSIIALKAKADEYRKKGADNFKIGADLFSYKEPYPPKEVLDDRAIPSSIKSLLIGAFHDEEKKLNKDYENSLKDNWEHEWPAPEHKKQENIQYDLRRRLRGEAIAAREHLKKFKDTTADDDINLSGIDEE